MPVSYNDIVGQQVGRLANLSDSIFGVAMTLLVLEVRIPSNYITTDRQLVDGLLALGSRFLVYFMSFLTLGLFWNAQQVQLSCFDRGDRLHQYCFCFVGGAERPLLGEGRRRERERSAKHGSDH